MKKLTFGTPEKIVPSCFCKNLNYTETDIKYNVSDISFKNTARGCVIEFPLKGSEQIYGFGLQLKGFNHKGTKLSLKANADPVAYTGDSHAPVPFFVTTEGYGMYFDTARYIEVQCGFTKKRFRTVGKENELISDVGELYKKENGDDDTVMTVTIPGVQGIDIYIFEGENILDTVSQYNMFSGGGCSVPDWSLGTMFRAYLHSTGNDIMNIADYFRKNDIPCDIIGIEPGWQSACYSCSYVWDSERFPNHKEVVKYLRDNGFHINLWEHAFVSPKSPLYKPLFNLSGNYEVWEGLVPDFSLEKAQEIFAAYHKKNFTDEGIDGFKLDECDSGDFVGDWSFPNCAEFPGGMDGEEYFSYINKMTIKKFGKILGRLGTTPEYYSEIQLRKYFAFPAKCPVIKEMFVKTVVCVIKK